MMNGTTSASIYFGSLDVSMMPLCQTTLGGIPWGETPDVWEELDVLHSIIFVPFIPFMLVIVLITVAVAMDAIEFPVTRSASPSMPALEQSLGEMMDLYKSHFRHSVDQDGVAKICIELLITLEDLRQW